MMLFHKRKQNVSTLAELRDILARFLKDDMHYDLEWDDFISWKNDNEFIESIRLTVGETEPLFFSQDQADRDRGIEIIRQEIGRIDLLTGRNSE